MIKKKLKISFVGFGKFAQVRKRYLLNLPYVELVGFYDPFQECIHDISKIDSLDNLLEISDAVIISVPPKLAPAYVCKALEKGKKVFCEKPAAVSVEDLKIIERYLTDSSLLAYGFNHRQHPSIEKIKETIEVGTLGKILWMRGRYGKEVNQDYIKDWRCNIELNGGGILIDQGIHMVDLMSYLSNGFDGAQAVMSNNYLGIEGVDDNGFITLYSTVSKITASIHSTVTQWRYLFSLEIFLEKGSIILNGLRTNSGNYGEEILTIKPNLKYDAEIETIEIKYPENVSWEKEMMAFAESALIDNPYPYANYKDALRTTKLIDLIYKEAIWI